MAVILAPVPTGEVSKSAALAYLGAQIGAPPAERLEGLLEAAAAMVQREASAAPQAVKNEAVIRFAGRLWQSDYGGIAQETIGPRSIAYNLGMAGLFRLCGAKGLLAPWKVRRAGAIG